MKKTAKEQRNKAIVRAIDSGDANFKGLAKDLELDRKTIKEVYWREKLRAGEKNVPMWVQKRYKKLSTQAA